MSKDKLHEEPTEVEETLEVLLCGPVLEITKMRTTQSVNSTCNSQCLMIIGNRIGVIL